MTWQRVLVGISAVSGITVVAVASVIASPRGGDGETPPLTADTLVPISVVVASILTTAAVVWWCADVSGSIRTNRRDIDRLKAHRESDYKWQGRVDRLLTIMRHKLRIDDQNEQRE